MGLSFCRASIRSIGLIGLFCVALATTDRPAHAQIRNAVRAIAPFGGGGAAPAAGTQHGTQNLPYNVADNEGNNWTIQQGGWLQQRSGMPIYSQGAMLQINGGQPGQPNNMARWDEKSGELVIENMRGGDNNSLQITRRIFINRAESYVRYIDILKNTSPQDQSVQLQIQTSLNYGVNGAQNVTDPKKADQVLGWVGQTGANRCAVEVFAGRGAKQAPQLNAPQGSNVVQANMPASIPAGKEIALMHLHMTTASPDVGVAFINNLKPAKILAGVSPDVRKLIVNFAVNQSFIGDREVLRGEMFDAIELRGGADVLNGTIAEKSYKLTTFYGPVELPASRVVGLINVGNYRPRQLVITSDGEIFGGQLDKDTIALQLSSGQTTQVPLSQVSRVGYRKRQGEPDEWSLDKPMVVLRSGDRMNITPPAQPIEVMTRYGQLKLDPKSIAAVVFQSDEHGVHEIHLTDGSKFAGLVVGDQFELSLVTSGQKITVPSSAIARLQLAGGSDDPDDGAPTLTLANQDVLVGAISGQLKLDTTFDTITVNGGEVRSMTHPKDAGADVQITLWDQTKLSGQLQEPAVTVALQSGVSVKIPVPLIQTYNQPQPQPSATVLERIKSVVTELNAEDWKQRDRAEAQLVSMGPAVVGTLRQLRDSQPPEAQQRIDSVLRKLEKAGPPGAPAAGGE